MQPAQNPKQSEDKKSSIGKTILIVIAVIGGLILLTSIINSYSNLQNTTSDVKSSSTEVQKNLDNIQRVANERSRGKAEIISHRLKNQKYSSSPSVVGEVKNIGTTPITYVKVIATFYDEIGDVVDTTFTYAGDTADTGLESEKTAPFELHLSDETPFDSYKLDVTWN